MRRSRYSRIDVMPSGRHSCIATASRMVTQFQAEGLVRFLGCRKFEVRNPAGLACLVEA
mgnify:CR=1 FL=1